jgi:Ca2+-binding RTX toxin-like protein
VLVGLGGNDSYVVYSVLTTIQEGAAQGNADRVASGLLNYALASGSDIEILTTSNTSSTLAVNLTGNELVQTIVGNAGDNILSTGGTGAADALYGLGGNDTYWVYNRHDQIVEGEGQGNADRVVVSTSVYELDSDDHVEIMIAGGPITFPDIIAMRGNDFSQEMTGNSQNLNALDGKGGNDILRGAGGRNFFNFTTAPGANNVDTILDFNAANDTISFENDIFTAIGYGSILPSDFRANTTGLAQDANDHIIYETDTGKLFYDADGNGGRLAVQFAVLTGHPMITADDFATF